jgi:hypothetical protein
MEIGFVKKARVARNLLILKRKSNYPFPKDEIFDTPWCGINYASIN